MTNDFSANQSQSTSTPIISPLINKINLTDVVEDLFLVLTNKEKEVIIKRFSLNDKPKETLEKIGKSFKITRERVRQIEKIALNKLRRTINNTRLKDINLLAKDILNEMGGIVLESILLQEILNRTSSGEPTDQHIIKLALSIDLEMIKSEKNILYYPFWRLKYISINDIEQVLNLAKQILEVNKDVIPLKDISAKTQEELKKNGLKTEKKFILSTLKVDKKFKFIDENIGLSTWRHINPKSIRDKAYIVLKNAKKPLHFIEIANKIIDVGFEKKVVTIQAVHNELIRHNQFVLVGRGLYALKEWGYQEGTVAEIIESLLAKKGHLSKQQIIKGVLKQRQVKKGTISLNLQKNSNFKRIGRALYSLATK